MVNAQYSNSMTLLQEYDDAPSRSLSSLLSFLLLLLLLWHYCHDRCFLCLLFFFSHVPSGPSGDSGRAFWARPCDVIARRMQFLRIPSSYKTFLQLIKHYYSYRKISISSWNPQKILFLACDAVARRCLNVINSYCDREFTSLNRAGQWEAARPRIRLPGLGGSRPEAEKQWWAGKTREGRQCTFEKMPRLRAYEVFPHPRRSQRWGV